MRTEIDGVIIDVITDQRDLCGFVVRVNGRYVIVYSDGYQAMKDQIFLCKGQKIHVEGDLVFLKSQNGDCLPAVHAKKAQLDIPYLKKLCEENR